MRATTASLAIVALLPLAACGGGGGAASNTPPSVTPSLVASTFDTKRDAYLVDYLTAAGGGNVDTTSPPTTGTYNFAGTTRIRSEAGTLDAFGSTDFAVDFASGLVSGVMYDVDTSTTSYTGDFEYTGTVSDTGKLSGGWSGTVGSGGVLPQFYRLTASTNGEIRGATASSADYLVDGTGYDGSAGLYTGTWRNTLLVTGGDAVQVLTEAERVD